MNHVYVNHFLDSVRLSRSFRPAQVLQIQINAGIIYPIGSINTKRADINKHHNCKFIKWGLIHPGFFLLPITVFKAAAFKGCLHHLGDQSSCNWRPWRFPVAVSIFHIEIPSAIKHGNGKFLEYMALIAIVPNIYIYICLSIGGWNSIYPGNGHHLPGFEWKSKTKNHPRAFSRQLWLPEGSGPSLGRVSGKVLKQFLGQTCGCLADSISTSIVYNALIYIYNMEIYDMDIWIHILIYCISNLWIIIVAGEQNQILHRCEKSPGSSSKNLQHDRLSVASYVYS